MNFNLIASDHFTYDHLEDVETFVDNYPDFQTVVLENHDELKLLLAIIGIDRLKAQELNNTIFPRYWDLSDFKLPEFDEQQFNQFYESWLYRSHRDNNMDEYGNLIFLQGLSCKWNQLRYRIVVEEKELCN